jgi:hypothetical protein
MFNPAQVPAHVRARGELSAMAKSLAGGAVGGGKRISIKGGVFRLMSGGKEIAAIEDRYLDVVFVNAAPNIGRIWYAKAYDGDANAPDCWSADGKTPSPDAANKQSDSCDGCQKNIAGSGQGNSRACRFQQRLAVVLANDVGGDVLQLALPATSLFGKGDNDQRPLQEYARYLAAQNVDPSDVVTRMKFDTKSESPKLTFKAMRWVESDEQATIKAQGESDDAVKAVTMTVAKIDNVKAPAPIFNTPRPAPKAEAKAESKVSKPADLVADETEEPVVRKEEKKPSAVPAKKGSLAAMVDDWDDEA